MKKEPLFELTGITIEDEYALSMKELVIPNCIDVVCIGEKRLSLLICSIQDREKSLGLLLEDLEEQKTNDVEILVEVDNKELTVGAKRNLLLEKAKGDYVAFIDDDDAVSVNYITKILEALKTNPDCCSLEGILIRPGRKYKFCHSIEYEEWFEEKGIYYRYPNHLNVVKRELVLQVGFPEMDVGEDFDYSTRLKPLLKTESLIEGILYYYVKDKKWRK